RARRRRRIVGGSLTAAAVVVAAIAITPMMLQGVGSGGADSASVSAGGSSSGESAADESAVAEEAAPGSGEDAERRVIRTANATLVVDDIPTATDEITQLADEFGGYVEQLGSSGGEAADVEREYGWITLRIPADRLDGARASLDDIGDVASIEISAND